MVRRHAHARVAPYGEPLPWLRLATAEALDPRPGGADEKVVAQERHAPHPVVQRRNGADPSMPGLPVLQDERLLLVLLGAQLLRALPELGEEHRVVVPAAAAVGQHGVGLRTGPGRSLRPRTRARAAAGRSALLSALRARRVAITGARTRQTPPASHSTERAGQADQDRGGGGRGPRLPPCARPPLAAPPGRTAPRALRRGRTRGKKRLQHPTGTHCSRMRGQDGWQRPAETACSLHDRAAGGSARWGMGGVRAESLQASAPCPCLFESV
mmetsp:Transcript_74315/g.231581  ORF Transcript_74315/g.231581 Transcript_74315/m.231581 type:complete len:270 (+) Transcript_74315:850-1659(+)